MTIYYFLLKVFGYFIKVFLMIHANALKINVKF